MVGETTRVPDKATGPIPWFMETEVALVVDQERVEEAPEVMVVGEAVKEEMVGIMEDWPVLTW